MQNASSQRTSFYVIASAILITLVFHFTLAEHMRGFATSFFFLLLVAVTHGLFWLTKIKPNRWSYVFLAPVLFSAIALSLYASNQAQVIGFLIATVSFMLFAYWSTAPLPRWELVQNLLPMQFFRETLLPFGFSSTPFQGISQGKKWKSIVMGLVISVPILFVFMILFASADAFFNQTIGALFFRDFDIGRLFAKSFWDIILFIMITHCGWLVWTRVIEQRLPTWNEREIYADHTIVQTVLAVLNGLFLVFIGFQCVYFFGGHDYIQSHQLVYSEYMRQGFDQLLAAAGLVLGGILVLHRVTQFRSKLITGLCLSLIVETCVILISATKRLWLYVDAYHLSIQRYWGFVTLLFVSMMLMWYLVNLIRQQTFSRHFKQIIVATLWFFSAVLLVNQNAIIASWNLTHVSEVVTLDMLYMSHLMPDAAIQIHASQAANPALWQGQHLIFTDVARPFLTVSDLHARAIFSK